MPNLVRFFHLGTILLGNSFFSIGICKGQQRNENICQNKQALFSKGDIQQWLSNHTIYPFEIYEHYITTGNTPPQQRIYVKFNIQKDGSIDHTEIVQGDGPEFCEEALAVIQSMPRWSPGKHKGHFVRVVYTIPVIYSPF